VTVRVRVLRSVAGPDYSYAPGDLADLRETEAAAWITGNLAEPVPVEETTTEPEPPTTTAEQPETPEAKTPAPRTTARTRSTSTAKRPASATRKPTKGRSAKPESGG
jgi:hypothetical protein